jgi:hypothetical protein
MARCCECGDEPSGSCITELVLTFCFVLYLILFKVKFYLVTLSGGENI